MLVLLISSYKSYKQDILTRSQTSEAKGHGLSSKCPDINLTPTGGFNVGQFQYSPKTIVYLVKMHDESNYIALLI